MTMFEIAVLFETDRATAEPLLEDVAAAACGATGGRGEECERRCGGFISAGLPIAKPTHRQPDPPGLFCAGRR